MLGKNKKISAREKMLVLLLVFVAIGVGFYTLYSTLQEERTELESQYSLLESERLRILEYNKGTGEEGEEGESGGIIDIVSIVEEKEAEVASVYKRVPNDLSSSIEFENIFLGWIKGRDVQVKSFAFTKQTRESLSFPEPKSATIVSSDLKETADAIDQLDGVVNREPDAPKPPSKEGDDGKDTPEKEKSPEIFRASFTYNLELPLNEYTRLLDKINDLSEFYHLESSDFTPGEGGKGIAVFTIKAYAYDKPDRYKEVVVAIDDFGDDEPVFDEAPPQEEEDLDFLIEDPLDDIIEDDDELVEGEENTSPEIEGTENNE